jgi:GNAT superfamily N-acetyltransferase
MVTRAPSAVRPARTDDAHAIARLAGQLGYPTSDGELAARLPGVAANRDAVVLVVSAPNGVHGWIHVELKRSLLAPLTAQVMGLVVDERRRNEGIGAALLEAGEAWARERGCRAMLVGTRVTRERAHRFYRREGYELLKTSHFFEKAL